MIVNVMLTQPCENIPLFTHSLHFSVNLLKTVDNFVILLWYPNSTILPATAELKLLHKFVLIDDDTKKKKKTTKNQTPNLNAIFDIVLLLLLDCGSKSSDAEDVEDEELVLHALFLDTAFFGTVL